MRRLAPAVIAAILAVSAAQAQQIGNNPGKGTWLPGPAGLPKGAKMIVLSGDPAKAGPYTIKLRFPPGYKIGPHRHPTDENIKVITGGLTFGMGAKTSSNVKNLSEGMKTVAPANHYHFASTGAGATVQISGTGPFGIEYAQAKDDPRKR